MVTTGTAKSATATAADTDKAIEATDLPVGNYYVYAVDGAGNVSAHSTG